MLQIMVAPKASNIISASLMNGMFKLRKKVFKDRLNWSVPTYEDRELDAYDYVNPVYMVAFNSDNPDLVLGCWRMIPTTNSYMLGDVFTPLLGNNRPPANPSIWEVSRFAVARMPPESGFGFGTLATAMLRALWCQARRQGLSEIIGVTSIPVERMLIRTGFTVHRFSSPQKFGNVLSVAFRLPVTPEAESRIFSRNTTPIGEFSAWRAVVGQKGHLLSVSDICTINNRTTRQTEEIKEGSTQQENTVTFSRL